MLSADLQDLGAPWQGQRDAARVVEIRDGVEELDPLALRRHVRDGLAQRTGLQTVLVHRDVYDLGLVRAERAERTDVGRALGEDDVSRVAEDAGDHVQGHLGARGDHHVIRVGGDPLQRHDLADLLAQLRHPVRGAVLQGDLAVDRDQPGDLGGQRVQRQRGEVRHAAGQRDHLGAAGDGEESSDLGGGHPCGPLGVVRPVRIQVACGLVERARAFRHGRLASLIRHIALRFRLCAARPLPPGGDDRVILSVLSPRPTPHVTSTSRGMRADRFARRGFRRFLAVRSHVRTPPVHHAAICS